MILVFPKIGLGPPNHPILIGFSLINHPFWGTPIFGNTHFLLGSMLIFKGEKTQHPFNINRHKSS